MALKKPTYIQKPKIKLLISIIQAISLRIIKYIKLQFNKMMFKWKIVRQLFEQYLVEANFKIMFAKQNDHSNIMGGKLSRCEST